jgi:hypothetical protein
MANRARQGENAVNVKSPEIISEIKKLVLLGEGIRPIMKALGVAKSTVAHYRTDALFEAALSNKDILCRCGSKIGHRSWCSYRLEKSPKRREFLKVWTGSKTDIILAHNKPPAMIRKWKEPIIWLRQKGELEKSILSKLPGGIPHEIRDDLCQDLVVAVLAGELSVGEIPTKIIPYLKNARQFLYNRYKHISIDGLDSAVADRLLGYEKDFSENLIDRIEDDEIKIDTAAAFWKYVDLKAAREERRSVLNSNPRAARMFQ